MMTKAVRLYGKEDLRLETFALPPIKDDEILAKVVSDSICMSSYKAAMQGCAHKRVPDNCAENPVMVGHEFCGELIEVGAKWANQFKKGDRFSIQPAMNYQGSMAAPGYSYPYIGGNATYIVIPNEVMETGSLLPYNGDAYFYGSLAEPMSCIVGAFHASYHVESGSYVHKMGIVPGGRMAILAGAGPMGMGAVDYALHNPGPRPSLLVVTDIDEARLARTASLLTVEDAAKHGVALHYINTADPSSEEVLRNLAQGEGYDDVFCFAPVQALVELSDRLLGKDGCLNFFAGPTNTAFSASLNFYNVHYSGTHIVGTSGGNTDDLRESIALMEQGVINPAAMITHIGGLDSVVETTLNLPNIPGGKKLVYTHIAMPLTAIADFERLGKTDSLFATLAEICSRHNGLWSLEAEEFLLSAKTLAGEEV